MLANNNLKVCWTLVRRDFRFHRVKNAVLALAVALVTGLYAFVFLLGGAVEGAFLLNYQYTYGSTSHILYSGLTEHQADLLSQHPNIKSTVRLSTIGTLSDPMMGQRLVKLAVTDQDYAETVLSVPTTGGLPQQPGEIALDEFTMGSLGIVREIGAPVTLQWTDASGQVHTDEFTLCGWWASPTNFTEACAWITAETAQTLVPDYDSENAANLTLGVTLHQPRDLDAQAAQILADQGLPELPFTTNLAYNDARLDLAGQQARPYYAPALLVLVCGFLMIFAIVQVTAEQDRAYFAGLKALGLSPRQLRRYLLEKGIAVTALGLVPGFLIGFGLNLAVTPRVVVGMDQNPALYFMGWQPFALAAVCALGTTLLAYLLPTLRLARLTPAQTLRLNAPQPTHGGGTKNGMVTLPRLALRTLGRGKGRMVLSVVILLAAVLLLTDIRLQYVSLQEDLYLEALSPWDYSIADASAATTYQRYNEHNQGITQEMVEELNNRPEVTSVSALKSREVSLTADETLRARVVDYYNQPYDETMTLKESQAAFPDWMAGLDRFSETGAYTAIVVGLDGAYLDYVLENCPFTSGSFDQAAFASGEYVIAGGAYHEGVSCLAAGETLELEGQSFTVMGSLMHDNAYLEGANSPEASFTFYYLVPLPVFEELFPGQGYRQLAVDIDHSQQSSFEAFLSQYEQGLNRGISVTMRSDYQQNFENSRLNMVLILGMVGAVLLLIALLNFVNLLVTKTVSRRREFAVYQSLGMTLGQLQRLVLLEGAFSALILAVVLVPVTIAFAALVMPGYIANLSWVSVYTFDVTPLWIILPVAVALALLTPLICLRFLTKGTIQQRLGVTE